MDAQSKPFEITDLPELDGATPVATPREDIQPKLDLGKYDKILEMIENPNTSVAAIGRMISVEIAKTTKISAELVGSREHDPTAAWKIKMLTEHIKALRELAKQLSETDVLSKKDILNMSGPKFLFAMAELAKLYKRALKEAGVETSLIENAMRHFADLVSVNQERLQKDVDQLDSGK